MRTRTLTTLAIGVFLLSSCAGSDTSSDGDARQAQQSALRIVHEALPLARDAVDGNGLRADAGWTSCLPEFSWKYSGGAVFTAPERQATVQLESIREALVEAGHKDVTQMEGQVAVERDGFTLVFSPYLATGDPKAWQVTFTTRCLSLEGGDKEMAETDTWQPVDGLERRD